LNDLKIRNAIATFAYKSLLNAAIALFPQVDDTSKEIGESE